MAEVVGNNIPPLSSLPQWPRVGVIGRTVAGKQQKDGHEHLNTMAPVQSNSGNECSNCGAPISEGAGSSGHNFAGLDVQELARHLDKSIHFLKLQQHELLTGLHDEVDNLKRENKDLQFKLVMMENANEAEQSKNSLPTQSSDALVKEKDVAIHRLRDELEKLKTALEEAKEKNGMLERIMDQQSSAQGGAVDDLGDDQQQHLQLTMHARALEQCDRLIKHLQQVNEQQALEVSRLKAELKDLLSTYRPAPDIGLLSNRNKMLADSVRLPKLASEYHSHRPMSPDVIPGGALAASQNLGAVGGLIVRNSIVPRPPSQPPPRSAAAENAVASVTVLDPGKASVHLPPLKQVVPSRIAERKKQIQVLHKARLRQLSSNVNNSSNNNNI